MSVGTTIKCFNDLFSIFGHCSYVHSDQWSAFQCPEFKNYFLDKGTPTSRSNPYHPQGNGQVERYKGIVWKAVKSTLNARDLPIKQWERVFSAVLHVIR